jgi:hypothetical protein
MSTGLQMSDEDREFITNMAQMEGGQMVIKVPEGLAKEMGVSTTLALSEITGPIKDELIRNREDFKKQDSMSIAMNQLTLTEQIDRNVSALAMAAKVRLSQALKSDFEQVGLQQKMELLAGSLGIKEEELGNLQKLEIFPDMDKWVGKIRGLLISDNTAQQQEGQRLVQEALKQAQEKEIADRKEKVEITHIHQYNSSPTLLDNMGRFIARSPETWEEMYSSNMPEEKSFLYSRGQ